MKSFRHGLLALAWCLVPNIADGQFVEPPPPLAYAVQGATIVRADGSRAEGVNLVVRGGFIEAIGPDVPIPADALLLEGDSLFVYPGIVDGQSGAVVEFPDVESNPSEVDFWAPARGEQQFTPHRRAADYLTATGSDMAAERSKGVVAGAILAEGPVMPGRGAVLLFRKSADLPSDLVLRPEFGLMTSFRGASGVYPSTGFGMHAFIRQSFEDARHYAVLRTAHAQDPRGIPIPSYDPDYDVLNAALNRQVPVFIQADRSDEIRRALDIADEYGFQAIIVGGAEAWRVADLLNAKDVAVLVSVAFSEPERWDPEAETDEPLDAAADREKIALENEYANAGRLAEAGVRFALTSGGGETDIRDGARTAIEHGLSQTDALRAITSSPADLLGVSYLANIETDFPATFVVTDGPLFDEETKILHTFVAGEHEEGGSAAGPSAGDEEPTVDVTGEWRAEFSAGGQSLTGTMILTQTGATFTGTIELDIGMVRFTSGSVAANKLAFSLELNAGGEILSAEGEATVEGDTMRGSGDGDTEAFTFVARRIETPNTEVR